MQKSQKIDATKGPLLRSLLLYAIPLILSTLVQCLFNSVDLIVLANMADSGAVASVGATSTIIHLIVNAFIGISAGSKIILARYLGANEEEKIRSTVNTALLSSILFGIAVAVFGIIFAPDILRLSHCPDDCFDGAVLYIRIYIAAAPFVLFYNFGAAIITAAGDTQRPFSYITAGGILNVFLNIILCLLLPQKVAAVAIATAAAQILSAVLIGIRLCRIKSNVRVILSQVRWSFAAFWKILRFGLPLFFSQILFPLANLQMQTAINDFGVSAIAGNSAATTLESMVGAFTNAFATTATVFIGQNLGAKNLPRAKKSFFHCLWLACAIGLIIGVFLNLTARFWFSFMLADDPEAIEYAVIRLRFLLIYWAVGIDCVLMNTNQTLGGTLFSALNSAVCVFVLRILWLKFIFPLYPTFFCITVCFMASWIVMLFTNTAAFLYYNNRLRKGKLADI